MLINSVIDWKWYMITYPLISEHFDFDNLFLYLKNKMKTNKFDKSNIKRKGKINTE